MCAWKQGFNQLILTLRNICRLDATRLGPRLGLGLGLKLVLGLAVYYSLRAVACS